MRSNSHERTRFDLSTSLLAMFESAPLRAEGAFSASRVYHF
jgi:hypothetical protein